MPRTDQAAPQEARVADRPEVPAPVTSASTKAFVTSSMTSMLNAKSKEEPRAQRRTKFWIAANDWP